jgi:hypothetical protein
METHGSGSGTGGRIPAAAKVERKNQPMEAIRVVIDEPAGRCLTKPNGTITGWFGIHQYEIPDDFQFRVGPIALPYTLLRREDVEEALPEYGVTGFRIRFDLMNFLPYIDEKGMLIQLTVLDFHPFPLRFSIQESALAICVSAASGV